MSWGVSMIPYPPPSSPHPDRPLVIVAFALTARTETEEELMSRFNRKVCPYPHVEEGALPPLKF